MREVDITVAGVEPEGTLPKLSVPLPQVKVKLVEAADLRIVV
jgi:hypothetical protein